MIVNNIQSKVLRYEDSLTRFYISKKSREISLARKY